ncbi:MAG: site-specific integrase [Eggerthellaceae bacterium]|nr:site-specific integrase [Eggerthellaceae bacterium]
MRRRGDGDTWEITLSHKDPMTGELVRTYHYVTARTEKQAAKARDELILELERKGMASVTQITVREFLDAFLEHKESSKVIEPATMRDYRHSVKLICKYLDVEQLSEVNIPAVSKMMANMTADGYAPKSVAKPFRLLKQALNWALAQDLIVKNPCNFCKPPKRVKTPINALTRTDRSRMLDLARRAQPAPLGIAIELALTTGMRRGEICALKWSDLNENSTITVNHALGNGEGGFYLKAPKTESSRRTIPLTSHTYNLLCAVRTDALRNAHEFGFYGRDAYILGTQETNSRPYNPTQLGKDFAAFCKMNGFNCTFHDLRHTFATMMIANGCDVRTVASYLGHSSVSMTLDIYADVDPDAKKAAVDKVLESFDVESSFLDGFIDWQVPADQGPEENALVFTAQQLRAMLAEAERREAENARL